MLSRGVVDVGICERAAIAMISFCVQCLKKFEGRDKAQEFCTIECRTEHRKAVMRHRKVLRDDSGLRPGKPNVRGHVINFGSHDGREKDDYNQ
jgi:hypothetical protein